MTNPTLTYSDLLCLGAAGREGGHVHPYRGQTGMAGAGFDSALHH